jgi:hypothetical protein
VLLFFTLMGSVFQSCGLTADMYKAFVGEMVSVCSGWHGVCASETGAIVVGGCISGEWRRNWGWQEFVVDSEHEFLEFKVV